MIGGDGRALLILVKVTISSKDKYSFMVIAACRVSMIASLHDNTTEIARLDTFMPSETGEEEGSH
jgi:hypothetical protein